MRANSKTSGRQYTIRRAAKNISAGADIESTF